MNGYFQFISIFMTIMATSHMTSYAQDNLSNVEHISNTTTWQPSDEQKRQVETLFKHYKTLLSEKKYKEAFRLHTPSFKQQTPFDRWLQIIQLKLKDTGGNSQYVATKITWYKNPSNAPKLGIYTAVDYKCSYANINICTGYTILYSEQGVNFAFIRIEETIIDKEAEKLMQEQKIQTSNNSPTAEDVNQTPKVICDIGPVTKNYGEASWLVYSCNDKQSVIIVSDTGNPAMPFMFTFQLGDSVYNLYGEGNGSKATTKATYDELRKLSKSEIEKLISETKLVKKKANKT